MSYVHQMQNYVLIKEHRFLVNGAFWSIIEIRICIGVWSKVTRREAEQAELDKVDCHDCTLPTVSSSRA